MIKYLQRKLGIHLTALLIGLGIFITPKLLHDNYEYYKNKLEKAHE